MRNSAVNSPGHRHQIANCVENGKDDNAAMQKQGNRAQKGQHHAQYETYAEGLDTGAPA